MAKGLELPREFTNIPLILLWDALRIGNELRDLSSHDKAYWEGWHDCMAVLLSDLTHRPTITLKTPLAALFEDFRMEERLSMMETQLRKDNGGLG